MTFVALEHPRTLGSLVDEHGGELDDALDVRRSIFRVGISDGYGDYDLAPVLHARGAARVSTTAPVLLVAASIAGAVVVGRRWIHPRADLILARLLFATEAPSFVEGAIHPSARVDERATIEPGARIGRDVVIEAGALVSTSAVVYPRVHVGRDVIIGASSVIGRPGFGFVDGEPGNPAVRIPHRAGVILSEGVELGALCTVDAGVLSPTTIGAHSKLDAQVHVGHGVVLGARCRVAAQVGFAGSVIVEDDVFIGGQAGLADHVRVGRGARIAAKAGVIGDVPAGATFAGYPAVARGRWLRGHARLYRENREK